MGDNSRLDLDDTGSSLYFSFNSTVVNRTTEITRDNDCETSLLNEDITMDLNNTLEPVDGTDEPGLLTVKKGTVDAAMVKNSKNIAVDFSAKCSTPTSQVSQIKRRLNASAIHELGLNLIFDSDECQKAKEKFEFSDVVDDSRERPVAVVAGFNDKNDKEALVDNPSDELLNSAEITPILLEGIACDLILQDNDSTSCLLDNKENVPPDQEAKLLGIDKTLYPSFHASYRSPLKYLFSESPLLGESLNENDENEEPLEQRSAGQAADHDLILEPLPPEEGGRDHCHLQGVERRTPIKQNTEDQARTADTFGESQPESPILPVTANQDDDTEMTKVGQSDEQQNCEDQMEMKQAKESVATGQRFDGLETEELKTVVAKGESNVRGVAPGSDAERHVLNIDCDDKLFRLDSPEFNSEEKGKSMVAGQMSVEIICKDQTQKAKDNGRQSTSKESKQMKTEQSKIPIVVVHTSSTLASKEIQSIDSKVKNKDMVGQISDPSAFLEFGEKNHLVKEINPTQSTEQHSLKTKERATTLQQIPFKLPREIPQILKAKGKNILKPSGQICDELSSTKQGEPIKLKNKDNLAIASKLFAQSTEKPLQFSKNNSEPQFAKQSSKVESERISDHHKQQPSEIVPDDKSPSLIIDDDLKVDLPDNVVLKEHGTYSDSSALANNAALIRQEPCSETGSNQAKEARQQNECPCNNNKPTAAGTGECSLQKPSSQGGKEQYVPLNISSSKAPALSEQQMIQPEKPTVEGSAQELKTPLVEVKLATKKVDFSNCPSVKSEWPDKIQYTPKGGRLLHRGSIFRQCQALLDSLPVPPTVQAPPAQPKKARASILKNPDTKPTVTAKPDNIPAKGPRTLHFKMTLNRPAIRKTLSAVPIGRTATRQSISTTNLPRSSSLLKISKADVSIPLKKTSTTISYRPGMPTVNMRRLTTLPGTSSHLLPNKTVIPKITPTTTKASIPTKGRTAPTTQSDYTCTICSRQFRNMSLYETHKQSHKPPRTTVAASPAGNNKCRYCDRKFAILKALDNHLLQNCTKIPPDQKKKLLSASEKELQSTKLRSGSSSLSSINSSLDQAQKKPRQSLMPPPSQKKSHYNPKAPHSGVICGANKKPFCSICKLHFPNLWGYMQHCLMHQSTSVESDEPSVNAAKRSTTTEPHRANDQEGGLFI